MSKVYKGEGNVVSITLAAAQVAGVPMVIGKFLGVPVTSGAIGDTIAVSLTGVHNIPAVTGAAFVQGQSIVWDVSVDLADDQAAIPASGDLSLGCIAMETKTAGAGESVAVKINVGPNTVT